MVALRGKLRPYSKNDENGKRMSSEQSSDDGGKRLLDMSTTAWPKEEKMHQKCEPRKIKKNSGNAMGKRNTHRVPKPSKKEEKKKGEPTMNLIPITQCRMSSLMEDKGQKLSGWKLMDF